MVIGESPSEKAGKKLGKGSNLEEEDKMLRLNRLLVKVIRESLNFGELILHFIELNSSIRKDEILYNPEAFAKEMEKIFGDSSSIMLETIVKKLYARLGMKIKEGKRRSFREYIMEAAKNI